MISIPLMQSSSSVAWFFKKQRQHSRERLLQSVGKGPSLLLENCQLPVLKCNLSEGSRKYLAFLLPLTTAGYHVHSTSDTTAMDDEVHRDDEWCSRNTQMTDLKHDILGAALAFVPSHGWTWKSIAAGKILYDVICECSLVILGLE